MKYHHFACTILAGLLLPLFASAQAAAPTLQGWKHTGALTILTTPDGANLPAGAAVEGFPVLVRLDKDWFDFTQAKAGGEDVRFSAGDGAVLAHEVEEWDAAKGVGSVWVRIPRIEGNARQTIWMHWGKADAASGSKGAAVFDESNGYVSVWHLGDVVRDEVGTLESKDVGTTVTGGVVGKARHFAGKQGIFCGDKIAGYPSGDAAHTTSAWLRAEQVNGTFIGWGNEGGGRGSKVRMQFRSPPHVNVDSDFSNVEGKSRLPLGEWIHVVHTYGDGPRRIYINGRVDGEATTKLDIKTPARLWLGGWYNNYDFVGDMDEVRVSKVARPEAWVRLEFENQKPLHTLVGPIVQAGAVFAVFAVTPAQAVVAEGKNVTFSAQAGGAQKLVWSLIREGAETVVAVDRFSFSFDAGRVTGDAAATLRLRAVMANGVQTKDIPIVIKEAIAEPEFTLRAPATWDGRATIGVVPVMTKGTGYLKTEWSAGPFAVIKEIAPAKAEAGASHLLLKRAQNSGKLTVTATISNGGKPTSHSVDIAVTEPKSDAWVARVPAKDEKPEDGQFYARDDKGEGTLFYNGTLDTAASAVFLKLYADDKLVKTENGRPAADKSYTLSAKLKPGLVKYKVEFGADGKVLATVGNIVCGDAYIIEGQSNALATDTREQSPPETSEWIRSYGRPSQNAKDNTGNLWCLPVWKAQKGEKAELGWWGMELAKRLLESQKVPIFIINAAVGGTRIDQHQRSVAEPADLATIYGRLLWRVRQARLTHGIRGILWHQGENDQGSDGPTGGFGWEAYQPLFVEMAAAWKQDFPNVQQLYIFQIWPNSCSMARDGSGDRLREKQRTLPQLFSHMSIMSTLGVRPPGGCHFPLLGWAEFARMIQPLIERDLYGKAPSASITPPNLRRASYVTRDTISLEFDQPVVWAETLAGQFYLNGEKDKVASGKVAGNVLTLKLKEPTAAKTITYLKESAWSQETLLNGANGIAALTFCEVPIFPAK